MRRLRSLLWAAALAGSTLPVQAQTPFTFLNAGTVTAFGYYVGPYQGLMGTGEDATAVVLNCVDFFHSVVAGQTWTANVTNLGQTDLSNVRFGAYTNALDLYRQAAWLTTQYEGRSAAEIGHIQAAIWNLFSIGTPNPGSSILNYWLQQAAANYQTIDFSNFYVVTDVNQYGLNSTQEFIMQHHVTPEPATMALLGTGLVGIGTALRRRRRANREETGAEESA